MSAASDFLSETFSLTTGYRLFAGSLTLSYLTPGTISTAKVSFSKGTDCTCPPSEHPDLESSLTMQYVTPGQKMLSAASLHPARVKRWRATQPTSNRGTASNTTSITKPQDNLKVLSLYARSLRNKFKELSCLVSTENIDVIAITETLKHWHHKYWLSSEYNIDGYRLFNKDRVLHLCSFSSLLYFKLSFSSALSQSLR